MDDLALMLCGKIHIKKYIQRLLILDSLKKQLSSLVPEDSRYNRDCILWNTLSYDAFERCDFDLLRVLESSFKFDGSAGDNLNIYSTISKVYAFCNPSTTFTTIYRDSYDLLLDIAGEYFGGPEVDQMIDVVIQEIVTKYTSKKDRKLHAKERINNLFHVERHKLPHWLNGPNWPMGKNSPMKYLSTTKNGEGKLFEFLDVDTGETREVVEYY